MRNWYGAASAVELTRAPHAMTPLKVPKPEPFRYYAVAQAEGWGVYDSWEAAKQHRPQRYRGFNDAESAHAWFNSVGVLGDVQVASSGGHYYAVAEGPGWGVYTSVVEANRHHPDVIKGFKNPQDAHQWIRSERLKTEARKSKSQAAAPARERTASTFDVEKQRPL